MAGKNKKDEANKNAAEPKAAKGKGKGKAPEAGPKVEETIAAANKSTPFPEPAKANPVEIHDALRILSEVCWKEEDRPYRLPDAPEGDDRPLLIGISEEDALNLVKGNAKLLNESDRAIIMANPGGPDLWAFFMAHNPELTAEPPAALKPEGDNKPKKERKGKAAGEGGEKKAGPRKAGGEGGPGVIGSIKEFLEAAGKAGISASSILDKLAERFPDRAKEAMAKTVQAQLPKRMAKEKGISISTKKEGETTLFFVG